MMIIIQTVETIIELGEKGKLSITDLPLEEMMEKKDGIDAAENALAREKIIMQVLNDINHTNEIHKRIINNGTIYDVLKKSLGFLDTYPRIEIFSTMKLRHYIGERIKFLIRRIKGEIQNNELMRGGGCLDKPL